MWTLNCIQVHSPYFTTSVHSAHLFQDKLDIWIIDIPALNWEWKPTVPSRANYSWIFNILITEYDLEHYNTRSTKEINVQTIFSSCSLRFWRMFSYSEKKCVSSVGLWKWFISSWFPFPSSSWHGGDMIFPSEAAKRGTKLVAGSGFHLFLSTHSQRHISFPTLPNYHTAREARPDNLPEILLKSNRPLLLQFTNAW